MLVITLILVSLTLARSLTYEELEGKAVHVSLIYRHGERTPKWVPKTDPYDEKFWPEGFGQLTDQGMLHHYRLGQSLRTRYFHLLENGRFTTKTMCTLSTPFDRTIMSALSNLAGMFPISDEERFTDINWKPVPVYTTSLTDDKVLAMNVKCKSYEEELRQVMNSKDLKTKNDSYEEVYKIISNVTGKSLTNPENLQHVYSLLLIYEMKGLKLPEWSKNIYPEPSKEGSDYSFVIPTLTTKMKRLKSGPLLKKIVETFDEKIKNVQTSKCSNITAYSAHDDVVANFLNTIDVFNKLTPPFAACVMVELRKSENDYFVSVLYQNGTDPTKNEPHILKIPNCSFSCPFEKFKEIFQPVIPKNWDKECEN